MKSFLPFLLAGILSTASALSIAQDKGTQDKKGTLGDPQIAAILAAANTVDIDGGKFAKPKATSKDVKAFAEEMITDHTSANKEAAALLKKLHVKPEENATSKGLKEDGAKNLAQLKKLKGAAFDKAYIDNEVTVHQAVLDTIDKTLLPNVQNAEFKDLITKVRPTIASHLDHAKQIQSTLK